MAQVVIGNILERIVIRLLGRERPEATDYWDGNWVISGIEIRAGGFQAAYTASLHMDEFVRFHAQVEELYATVRGEARFESMESWLLLVLRADSLGHILIEGKAMDRAGDGNTLEFSLPELDQTYLPPILKQLREVERAYPLKGQREAKG